MVWRLYWLGHSLVLATYLGNAHCKDSVSQLFSHKQSKNLEWSLEPKWSSHYQDFLQSGRVAACNMNIINIDHRPSWMLGDHDVDNKPLHSLYIVRHRQTDSLCNIFAQLYVKVDIADKINYLISDLWIITFKKCQHFLAQIVVKVWIFWICHVVNEYKSISLSLQLLQGHV